MPTKLSFRTLFLALCLLAVSNSLVNAFSRNFFSKAPAKAVDQSQSQQQKYQLFTLPTNGEKRKFSSSLFMASNTYFDSGSKKVAVKQRARVVLDPKTGKMTELEAAPTAKNKVNRWNFVKEAFYNTADTFKSVRSSVANRDDGPARPVDGYGSTIEKTILESSVSSPGSRLMKEYQDRKLDTTDDERKSDGWFTNTKKVLYGTADGISNLVKSKEEKPLKSPLQTYKTVVQPTLASSPEIKDALTNLKSDSPAKRLMGELAIRQWEQDQKRRKMEMERTQAAESFKETMYAFGDSLVSFVQSLSVLPEKLAQAATATQEFVAGVPIVVENTVETVTSIPQKVDETVDQVTTTVETSVETTKKVVEDVQALPGKIEKTVKDTKRGVDETITNVKVLVGAEEKRPVPPGVPPPKPRTANELAWDIAGGVATVAGKAAWFVTVGAAKLSFAGAKLAYEKVSERVREQQSVKATVMEAAVDSPKEVTIEEKVKVVEEPAASSKSKNMFGSVFGGAGKQASKPKPAVAQESAAEKAEKEALDKEVSDALALAEKAMSLADETLDDRKKGKSDLDIALQKARAAAVTATEQAVEIEQTK